MTLPISRYQLKELANHTSSEEAVRQALKSGVIDFFLEAWTEYAFIELRDKNMLDGVSPVGALDLGRKIFENIADDFLIEEEASEEEEKEEEKKE